MIKTEGNVTFIFNNFSSRDRLLSLPLAVIYKFQENRPIVSYQQAQ
jgi:hypothetical protein